MVEKETIVTKEVKETKTIASPVASQKVDEKQNAEIEKLKKDLDSLKKKGKSKKVLSEYNLFVKRQLKAGRTFAQAVKLWKRQLKVTKNLKKNPRVKVKKGVVRVARKKVIAGKILKPKIVRVVARKPAIKTKKVKKLLLKKKKIKHKKVAKPKIKKVVKPKVKIITRIIKEKAKPKIRVVTRVIKEKASPIIIEKSVPSKEVEDASSKKFEEIALMISKSQAESHARTRQSLESLVEEFKKTGSFGRVVDSDEELALNLTSLYFREIARLGFKRSLELDSVINAYFYALARVKRKDFEGKEIMDIIKQ